MAVNLQGMKTVATGAAMVILPPLVEYVGQIDWNQLISTKYAFMVSGLISIALRLVTKTPVFQQSASINPIDPKLGGLK